MAQFSDKIMVITFNEGDYKKDIGALDTSQCPIKMHMNGLNFETQQPDIVILNSQEACAEFQDHIQRCVIGLDKYAVLFDGTKGLPTRQLRTSVLVRKYKNDDDVYEDADVDFRDKSVWRGRLPATKHMGLMTSKVTLVTDNRLRRGGGGMQQNDTATTTTTVDGDITQLEVTYLPLNTARTKGAIGVHLVYRAKPVWIINAHLAFNGDALDQGLSERWAQFQKILDKFQLESAFNSGALIIFSGDLNFRNVCDGDRSIACANNILGQYKAMTWSDSALHDSTTTAHTLIGNELYRQLQELIANRPNAFYRQLKASVFLQVPTCRFTEHRAHMDASSGEILYDGLETTKKQNKKGGKSAVRVPSTCDQILFACNTHVECTIRPWSIGAMSGSDHIGLVSSINWDASGVAWSNDYVNNTHAVPRTYDTHTRKRATDDNPDIGWH